MYLNTQPNCILKNGQEGKFYALCILSQFLKLSRKCANDLEFRLTVFVEQYFITSIVEHCPCTGIIQCQLALNWSFYSIKSIHMTFLESQLPSLLLLLHISPPDRFCPCHSLLSGQERLHLLWSIYLFRAEQPRTMTFLCLLLLLSCSTISPCFCANTDIDAWLSIHWGRSREDVGQKYGAWKRESLAMTEFKFTVRAGGNVISASFTVKM